MSKILTSIPRILPRNLARPLHTSNMPAFTLYGSIGSSNTDRVRMTLAEGGFTDYEFVTVDLRKGEQKSPENLARHPWGKIPNIQFANGFTLYESRAICKYLCQKYSFPLLPSASDLEATALFDQALSTESLYFADPAGKLGFEKFAKKLMGLEPNEAVVAEAEKGTQAYLDVAEKLLGEKEYMAGNEFTLADVFYVPLVGRLFASGYGEWIVGRPNVAKWWERVSERPAIKELIRKDREVLEKMRK